MTEVGSGASAAIRRELSSPWTWAAVGLFTLLSGAAFATSLNAFLDRGSEALASGQPVHVNQLLVRPFLLLIGMASLLVLPLVTARIRVTSAGSAFAAALAVYGAMLLTSAVLVGALFAFGSPEWAPIASGYLGLLLTGAAFIAVGLFVSSLATSAVAAGAATGALALALVAAAWLARSGNSGADIFRYLSIADGLDGFAKGVIDGSYITACVTVAAVALYLTHQAADPRRTPGRS
jgi:ABC-2 type transport system permease protein